MSIDGTFRPVTMSDVSPWSVSSTPKRCLTGKSVGFLLGRGSFRNRQRVKQYELF
jgi:hypothetical protein